MNWLKAILTILLFIVVSIILFLGYLMEFLGEETERFGLFLSRVGYKCKLYSFKGISKNKR
jgi:hypothetical protein